MWNVWARFSENSAISNLLLTLVPAGSSHLNTLDAAGASRMSIFCDGLGSSVSSPPALPQRFEFSPRICTFSVLPKLISELGKLCILKIAVRELLMNDVAILKGLPALNALSLYVRTAPAQTRIIFDQAGFPVLKYFKLRCCSASCFAFHQGAMPNLRRLKVGFNANCGAEQYSPAHTGYEHLSLGLEEISEKIGGAGADKSDRSTAAESALRDAISKHTSSPSVNIQWVDWIFHGEEDESRPGDKSKKPG